MNCPHCGYAMLEMPCFDYERKILEYYLCLDCYPNMRILKRCKWKKGDRCILKDQLCNLRGTGKGFIFCPQIRKWQEEAADWVKGIDHTKDYDNEFEQTLKEESGRAELHAMIYTMLIDVAEDWLREQRERKKRYIV